MITDITRYAASNPGIPSEFPLDEPELFPELFPELVYTHPLGLTTVPIGVFGH